MENVVIAGSGPAGLTAAIYAARANLSPLVFDGHVRGGQLLVAHLVENYPGFPEGISGMELMQRVRKQAERFRTRFRFSSVTHAVREEQHLKIEAGDEEIVTRSLIIATGAQARRLPIPSERRFYGKGVSGCATCDGFFYQDREVVVVGGGNKAMEDAVFLTRFASKVIIVHRREYLRADPIEVEKARKNPKIVWMIPWVVDEILGEDFVAGISVRNTETGEQRLVECAGVFVAIGQDPKSEAFREVCQIDDGGFIVVESGGVRTSTPGVFACGDVRRGSYGQAVVAAGEGCMAAMEAERYLGVRE
ncbi:MAG: thioredoxin-disulfide reductase [Candidatus Bipolaricaulota bacterium]